MVINANQPDGDHTWRMLLSYVRCPHCGYIMESRDPYEQRLDEFVKDMICQRCLKEYTIKSS